MNYSNILKILFGSLETHYMSARADMQLNVICSYVTPFSCKERKGAQSPNREFFASLFAFFA